MADHSRTKFLPEIRSSRPGKALPTLLAMISGAFALLLATRHPIAPTAAMAMAFVGWIIFFWRAQSWLLLLPALLPIIGFAPWTGWITFEELDILILAVAAGGYMRMAWPGSGNTQANNQARAHQSEAGKSVMTLLLLALFALSTLIAMFRGFSDAGGFVAGWFQGYHEPMNSVRLAKSFFSALLLLPLWHLAQRQHPDRSQRLLSLGLVLGLAVAALATVWERAAFTGLLNFSSDYRTTALFWEMHMGGAALDGFLALTLPFALREMLLTRSAVRWGCAASVLALAAYACLTTFSRGVYLATVIQVIVFLALYNWQRNQQVLVNGNPSQDSGTGFHTTAAILLLVGFGAGAIWVFQTSGYRGLLAVLSAATLMLPLAHVLNTFNVKQWLKSAAFGVAFSLVAVAISWLIPKGAYFAFGLTLLLTFIALVQVRRADGKFSTSGPMALAGFLALLTSTALVAEHWGETPGLLHALPLLVMMLAICVAAGTLRRPLWPNSLRWQASTASAFGAVAATIAVFGGGSYMSDRFSTGERDLGGRKAHWQLGIDMLTTPSDWLAGKGLGRFPANYFLSGNPQEHPGDYRWKNEGQNGYITLTSGLFSTSWGSIFRVSQRVTEPGRPTLVTARARAEKNVTLHFEVCEKHLLYNQNCVARQIAVKGMPGVWQDVRAELQGAHPTRGDWYAPRLIVFSMGMKSLGGAVDLDNVALNGPNGSPLLGNSDFSHGMANWFFTSDKHHLPWHAKSIFLNVLFDQGILGVTVWSLLLAGALWRTSVGSARRHPLAPALAASLVGFTVIGLFDSLLDIPRLAWLFYLLLMIALTVRPGPVGQIEPVGRIGQTKRLKTGRPRAIRSARAAVVVAMMVSMAVIGLTPLQSLAQDVEAGPQVIRVGSSRDVKTIAESAVLAKDGAIIEVDSGDYTGDVAVWTQDRLTLRAVGGRVRLIAAGAAAERKAIWVMRGGQISVEGFDFVGARVPDRNGAGIRFEKGALSIRNCSFTDNENGILGGNRADDELVIENSEFGGNGHGDGRSHNLYVGAIARLTVTGSYFHHANGGHLLKSRAAENHIFYNRLADGLGGRASYELEFPNGGVAYVVGNVIQQGLQTQNPHLVSFGAEGYTWPKNELYLINNTLVDDRASDGFFLRVKAGDVTVKAINNLLVGRNRLEAAGDGEYRNNFTVSKEEFEAAAQEDYRLKRNSSLLGKAVDAGNANGISLQPQAEYSHPQSTQRVPDGKRHNPGALQSARPASRP